MWIGVETGTTVNEERLSGQGTGLDSWERWLDSQWQRLYKGLGTFLSQYHRLLGHFQKCSFLRMLCYRSASRLAGGQGFPVFLPTGFCPTPILISLSPPSLLPQF